MGQNIRFMESFVVLKDGLGVPLEDWRHLFNENDFDRPSFDKSSYKQSKIIT